MAEGILDILKNLAGSQVSEKEAQKIGEQSLLDVIKSLAGAQVSEKEMSRIMEMIQEGDLPSKSMMIDTTTSAFGDAGRGREVP